MNTTIHSRDIRLTTAIDQFTRQRLDTALARLSGHIIATDIFIKDTNGPKGGIDKQALIRIRLRNRAVIALKSEHEDLYAAVKKGSKRARRTVRRHVRKSQRIQRKRLGEYLNDGSVPTVT